ncbi:hypothetical protein AAFG07_32965 [Bradyrhizobium sp. B097]|uniref:hypothetical protein n=1 Tax=Bradyrhizobium sp. B097 TaxID=3140244 RepID=UPI003182FA73
MEEGWRGPGIQGADVGPTAATARSNANLAGKVVVDHRPVFFRRHRQSGRTQGDDLEFRAAETGKSSKAQTMRAKKTADELRAILMNEVTKHPDWSHIEGVAITRSFTTEPGSANWNAGFVCDSPKMAPEAAFIFARELGVKYDLDGEP